MAEFLPQHVKYFADRASTEAEMTALGIVSVGSREEWDQISGQFPEGWQNWAWWPAFLIPWTNPAGETEWQIRPDEPGTDSAGAPVKFKTLRKSAPGLWAARVVPGSARSIVLEGVGKLAAALRYAPADVSLYAVAGVRMWQRDGGVPIGDLAALEGQEVIVSFDGDARTNRDVFDAGTDFRATLEAVGAKKVAFLQLPGSSGKEGVDDYLASLPEDKRADVLGRLITTARPKPASKRPAGKGQKAPTDRDALNVTNPADAADWLRETIGTGQLAGYFNRDDQVVHCPAEGEDGFVKLTDDEGDEDGPVQVRPVTSGQIAARIGFTHWCFYDQGGDGKRHALFPGEAARTVVSVPEMLPNVRRLKGVTHTPMVRRDGSVLDTPGYDPATGLYLLPTGGLTVPPVPEEPSAEQVRAAVALLDEVVCDFPFRSDDHRANFLGLAMTPLLRELCPPPYKLGVFDAPQSRSGKTLLSKLIRTLHGGVVRASIPADEAEWSKTLSTILNVTTAPVVTFDNVRGQITSGTLDGLLTEKQFDARQLGVTDKMISRRNDRLWTITSNNATLGGDLVKRAIWVSINANVANPETRSGFRHPDIVGWVQDHRGELLAALLTLVRAWVVAGRPEPSVPGTDIWARWTATVRAVLEFAGVPGVFDRPDSRMKVTSDEDTDWDAFLSAARRVYGDQPWTCRELLSTVRWTDVSGDAPSIHRDELPGDLGEKLSQGRDVTKALGNYIKFRVDAWAVTHVARDAGKDRKGYKLWRVERLAVGGAESAESAESVSRYLHVENMVFGERRGEKLGVGGPVNAEATRQTRQTQQKIAPAPAVPAPAEPVRCPDEDDHDPDWACLTCGRTA